MDRPLKDRVFRIGFNKGGPSPLHHLFRKWGLNVGTGAMWLAQFLNRPGEHEERLRRLFPDAMTYTADVPVYDHPLYVLGFTNRSGSNLLGEHLRSTGRFRGLREQLNGKTVESKVAKFGLSGFPQYVESIAGDRAHRWPFGVKASPDQLSMLLRCRIDRMFSGLRLIHIVREDAVAQAVSFSIASQTKTWTSLDETSGPGPAYKYDDILRRLSSISSANALLAHQATIFAIPYLKITYEELTADPRSAIRAVGRFANVDLDPWRPRETRLKKQATSLNEEFKKRFEWESRERFFGRADSGAP